MRQLVGCVMCARVDWIDEFVPCYLFKDCAEELLAQGGSNSTSSESDPAREGRASPGHQTPDMYTGSTGVQDLQSL